MIIRQPRHDKFTVINNDLINDERLGAKALGVLVYILSKPDNWKTSSAQLSKRFGCNVNTIKATLRELEAIGYLSRTRKRSPQGTFYWESSVFEIPTMGQKTIDGKTSDGKTIDGKLAHITKTDSTRTDLTKTELTITPLHHQDARDDEDEEGRTNDPFVYAQARQIAREVAHLQRNANGPKNFFLDSPWGNLAAETDSDPETVFQTFREFLEALGRISGKSDPAAWAGAIASNLFRTPGSEAACAPWTRFEAHYRLHRTAPEVTPLADTRLGQDFQRFLNALED